MNIVKLYVKIRNRSDYVIQKLDSTPSHQLQPSNQCRVQIDDQNAVYDPDNPANLDRLNPLLNKIETDRLNEENVDGDFSNEDSPSESDSDENVPTKNPTKRKNTKKTTKKSCNKVSY